MSTEPKKVLLEAKAFIWAYLSACSNKPLRVIYIPDFTVTRDGESASIYSEGHHIVSIDLRGIKDRDAVIAFKVTGLMSWIDKPRELVQMCIRDRAKSLADVADAKAPDWKLINEASCDLAQWINIMQLTLSATKSEEVAP